MRRCCSLLLLLAMALAVAACEPAPPPPPQPSTYEPTDDEQALLDRLATLQSQRGYDEGVAEAEAFLATHPEARHVYYAMGILHGLADRHEQALAAFEEELARDPGHISSYRGAANAHIYLGHAQAAIDLLRQAQRIAPDHPEVLLELGRALSNAGQLDEAEPVLRQAVAHGGAAARVELGILLRRQGRLEDAAEAFQAALRQDPKELGAMVNLGQTLIALGRGAEGQALLRRHAEQATLQDRLDVYRRSSLLDGATAANFLHLAALQVRARKSAEAVESYRRALELDPRSTTASLGLAALFRQDGQSREATKWVVHTLLLDPENARAHLLLGLMRLSKRQLGPAFAAFEASHQYEAWDAEAFWRVGDALRAQAQWAHAAQHYRQAIELDPAAARAHYGLGLTQFMDGQHEAAVASLRQAVALDGADADNHLLLGLVLDASGDPESAAAAFGTAAALHRLDLLTGRTLDQLLAPYGSMSGLADGLARYRGLLEEG